MIENPTRADLVKLIEKESGTCVSIIMRTHESGPETTQNPIRFKKLITEALEQVDDNQLRARLQELAKLEKDFDFWQHQRAGFGVFVCEGFEQQVKLSQAPDEIVYVADHFYISPITGALCGGASTRVLALTWERARLFASDGHESHEISDESFPVTMDELVTERDPEEQLQFSTHSTPGGGPSGPGTGSTAMYHGHGEGEDKITADRHMYLARVGRRVADEIYNSDHPLVVCATDEVAGHFTSTTDVKVADVIHASPDGLKDQDLHRRIVESSHGLLKKSDEELTERLGTAIANKTGSKDLKDIVLQAANGRVETLLIGNIDPQRGTFDREAQLVQLNEEGNTDLVNLALRETLRAGGSVAKLSSEEASHRVAAIYRY